MTNLRERTYNYADKINAIIIKGYVEELPAVATMYRIFTKRDRYIVIHKLTGKFAVFKKEGRLYDPDNDDMIIDWTDNIDYIA